MRAETSDCDAEGDGPERDRDEAPCIVTFVDKDSFKFAEKKELFPQLPRLAERLGVKPNEGEGQVWFVMNDGTRYDVFALVHAFLDRMDHDAG